MRNFYIVVPALSLLNIGVNGVAIANALTARGDALPDGTGPYKAMISHQDRQIHSADFSSDLDADADAADANTDSVQTTPSNPAATEVPRALFNNITSTDAADALLADDVSGTTAATREVQPAMAFKRRNGAPHAMARHVRRLRPDRVLKAATNEGAAGAGALSTGQATTNGVMKTMLATAQASTGGNSALGTTKGSLIDVINVGSTTSGRVVTAAKDVSKVAELLARDQYPAVPLRGDEECDKHEDFGDLVERTPSDSETLSGFRGMQGFRQIDFNVLPIVALPVMGVTVGRRSGLPADEGDLMGRADLVSDVGNALPGAVSALSPPSSAAINSATAGFPGVGRALSKRALGENAGNVRTTSSANMPDRDAAGVDLISRMNKRRIRRQDDMEAVDGEVNNDAEDNDKDVSENVNVGDVLDEVD